jgi:hypothetical protein
LFWAGGVAEEIPEERSVRMERIVMGGGIGQYKASAMGADGGIGQYWSTFERGIGTREMRRMRPVDTGSGECGMMRVK